jgi:hypothetical protein
MNPGVGARWVRILAASAVSVALSACGPSDTAPAPATKIEPSATDPHAQAQADMEKAGINVNHVVVVRLQKDGSPLEVTSIFPRMVSEGQVSGQRAKTIFRINDTSDGLVLFSRDLVNGKSYRTEMKFSELEAKKGFTFPEVQKDGSLKEQQYTLKKIVPIN